MNESKWSRIVYIGTTKQGIDRITQSAASKAKDVLSQHGVTDLSFHVVTCPGRGAVRTWEVLEKGLIGAFIRIHGMLPIGNNKGKRKWFDRACTYFTGNALEGTIRFFSALENRK